MSQFLGFAVPGIPFGCTYAIFAIGLVLTYQTTGIFNFGFAAQAYASAFLYTLLIESAHLPIWAAFVISVLVMAPLVGLLFHRFLFSRIPGTATMARLVTGIGLLVGIPAWRGCPAERVN